MIITCKITIRCDTNEMLTIKEAMSLQDALRIAVRELNPKMDLVLRGTTEAIASIQVDGGNEILINLGEHPHDKHKSPTVIFR